MRIFFLCCLGVLAVALAILLVWRTSDLLVARFVGQFGFELNEEIALDYNDSDALLFDVDGARLDRSVPPAELPRNSA